MSRPRSGGRGGGRDVKRTHRTMTGRLNADAVGRHRAGGSRGLALVIVLGMLSVITVMALHVTTCSEVAALEAKVLADRGMLRYAAESAADRAFWLLLTDRRNPDRALAEAPSTDTAPEDLPWEINGTGHTIQIGDIRVRVETLDADRGGLVLSGKGWLGKLQGELAGMTVDDGDRRDALELFLDVLKDYVDRGDEVHPRGKERPDYETEGYPSMPRNGELQYREEAFWLEGLGDAIPGMAAENPALLDRDLIRLIPPAGVQFPSQGKPSIYSAGILITALRGNLSTDEARDMEEAIQRSRVGDETLEELLDPSLLSKVAPHFSTQRKGKASGIAMIRATAEKAGIQRELRVTRDTRANSLRVAGKRIWLSSWEKVYP